ncbi:MltA domain-containing protein [Psychromarinibacter sp. C21-152]|uniref:peptidoglycan lytic exotransglycosylase n=1 Tax=Psychromarinibacter sediminicola TaxID=3033385 RepID=A0AAE3NUN0_9RHOB|nr:MltA domain-containing protein [Psychromarinibacter sediminicola]MDF0601290.1 MltA domain-containing protein [Psychromarinibacter sediminicola]
MTGLARVLAVVAGLAVTEPARAADDPSYTVLSFDELKGWEHDDHAAALDVFKETCPDMRDPDWLSLCALATNQKNARTFFELFFRPVLIEDGTPTLFTGYYEPELNGSRERTDKYRYPLYRKPDELNGQLYYTRREIEEDGVLDDKGLEIAWIDDPVDVFFLHIQGSGRVKFEDGSYLRVGYADKNGHDYRSVGQELVRRGIYTRHQVSAQVIRNWVKRNPEAGRKLLWHNPSFVFFREVSQVPPSRGPLGAMNRSITAMRSLAVDPDYVPLGAPVWIEKAGDTPMRRLMIAQDTGSAIKGAQRADIFFGTGDDAGIDAGKTRDPGRMVVLLPIQRAYALAPEGAG